MENWDYQEFVPIKCEDQSKDIRVQQLQQQQIACKISFKQNYILLHFNRNQVIRLSLLIKLHKKNIVIVSTKMILNIVKLTFQALKNQQMKNLIDGSVQLSDLWLNFTQNECVYITSLKSNFENATITNEQIHDLIIQIWEEYFSNQNQLHPAFQIAQQQIRGDIDLNFLPNSIELLKTTIVQNAPNFIIVEKVSNQFCLFIRLISQFQFEFIQSDRNVTRQFRSLILNELLVNHTEFVNTYRTNGQTALEFTQLLIQQIDLCEVLIFFVDYSGDILLEKFFPELENLKAHCLTASLLQEGEAIHLVRDPLIASQILHDLRNENVNRDQTKLALQQCLQEFKNQIKLKINQNLSSNLFLTQQFRDLIVHNVMEDLGQFCSQFASQIKSFQLTQLQNPLEIINNYIRDNDQRIHQAIQNTKKQFVRQIIQQTVHE